MCGVDVMVRMMRLMRASVELDGRVVGVQFVVGEWARRRADGI